MREGNVRVGQGEKLAVSLDGRQIASVVVGALVVLAVVFVLGLNVGRQIGARQAEAARAGNLEALDRAPATSAVPESSLTFHDRLTKAKPEAAPPPAAAVAPAPKPAAPAPAPVAAPAPAEKPAPAPEKVAAAPAPDPAPAARPPEPEAKPAASPTAPTGAYTIQLGASPDRAQAERLASKFEAFHPRVEPADVKGQKVWRVRVGSFESKDAAARYLADVTRETGAKGWVTSAR